MTRKKSKHIANILILLGILLTLSLMGYKTLTNGIYSPLINIGKIRIEGFFLQLNNKLILKIDKLDLSQWQQAQDIPQQKYNTQEAIVAQNDEQEMDVNLNSNDEVDGINGESVLKGIKYFLFVISYFEWLEVNSIVLPDGKSREILYNGKQYVIEAPEFLANFSVTDKNNVTELNINALEIIRLGLQVRGKIAYLGSKRTAEMEIAIMPQKYTIPKKAAKIQSAPDDYPVLYIKGLSDFSKIQMEAWSSHLYDLNSIKPFVQMLKNQALNDWLFKKIKFDVLKIHSLRFNSTFDKRFFTQLQKTLALDLAIESPEIYVDSKHPITSTRVILYMRDESLRFLFKEPKFNNTNLEGTEIKMSNVFTNPLSINIALQSQEAFLNDAMASLLESFGLSIPLRSRSPLKARLNIDIVPQNNMQVSITNGFISASKANIEFNTQQIQARNLQISFENTPLNGFLNITNTYIEYAKNIKGKINIMWDIKSGNLDGTFDIDSFVLGNDELAQTKDALIIPADSDELTKRVIEAIYADSQKGFSADFVAFNKQLVPSISVKGQLAENKAIHIPELGVYFYLGGAHTSHILEVSDISKLYPHSPLLQYFDVKKGSFKAWIDSIEAIRINADIDGLIYPLYSKNGQILSHIMFDGIINQKGVFINSKDKNITFIKDGSIIKFIFNDCNLNIDEAFNSPIPALSKAKESKDENLTAEQQKEREAFIRAKQKYERTHMIKPTITYFEAHNMNFYFNGYVIPSSIASVSLHDDSIRADISYGNGVANVDIAYGKAQVRLNNFSDTFLNQVWQRDIFDGGLFDFNGVYDEKGLYGQITMQNTIFKDFAIVQNVLGLIDTIPALITFRKPGLGSNGYEIKRGKVQLLINDEYLVLENINLVGSSIDIEGGGYVNLNTKAIDVALKASTLKSLANVISNIPIIGYVILGDDGKFTTGIVMKGTVDNPKSEVSVMQELLLSPFEMVGRILSPIGSVLDGLSESVQNQPNTNDVPNTQMQRPRIEQDEKSISN